MNIDTFAEAAARAMCPRRRLNGNCIDDENPCEAGNGCPVAKQATGRYRTPVKTTLKLLSTSPTPEMITAGMDTLLEAEDAGDTSRETVLKVFRAMLKQATPGG